MILDALESLNKIPCGCFEQTSSTTFPIVLALKILLKLSKTESKSLIAKMLENLKKGIKKLLSFETSTGGFEWFGKSPGHSTLTAYGYFQFKMISELQIEQNLVKEELFKRLEKFF